jgi:hypothetical protein
MLRQGIGTLLVLAFLGAAVTAYADEGDYTAPPPPAAQAPAAMAEHFEIFGQGGIAYYAMGDYNRGMVPFNTFLQAYDLKPVDPLNSGDTYGGGAAYWVTDEFSLGAQVALLKAVSGGDPFRGFHFQNDFTALEIGGFVRYGGFLSRELLGLVGVGAGSLNLSGASHDESWAGYGSEHYTLNGGCLAYQAFAEADYFLKPYVALGVNLGYRQAVITDVRANSALYHDVRTVNPDGSWFKLDFSGLFLTAALKFYIR